MGQLIQLLTELSCAGKHLLWLWGDRFCCHQGACECDVAADRDADVPLATGHPLAGASPCRFHWRQKHRRIGQCPSSPAMHRVRSCLELLRQRLRLCRARRSLGPRREDRGSAAAPIHRRCDGPPRIILPCLFAPPSTQFQAASNRPCSAPGRHLPSVCANRLLSTHTTE